MEYKGYKIESIKNDGHLQRNAFGIYKNGKLISTATTSKEAQYEVDNIMNRPVTIEYIIVNKKNDSKSRETIKATESDVDKKIKELERKYSNDKTYYLRDIRKVYDMRDRDPFAYEVIKKDIEMAKAGKASYITKGSLIRRITYSYSNRTPQSGGITTEQKNELMSLLSGVKDSCEMKTIDKLDKAIHTLDADIKLVKTVEKKNGYAIHIVEGGYGETIVLTFPGESYSNPHMWLGRNNPSNMNNAKNLLNSFSK